MELVGVAGTGKTTLAHTLSQRTKRITLGEHPYFRKVEHIPFFIWNTLVMVPTFIRLYTRYGIKCLTPRETAWMVILHGWHHMLRRQASHDGSIIVMDQGPVSIMAELSVMGPKFMQNHDVNKWWESTIEAWADVLDLLIWLDTSDPTLLKRVRTRDKWHLIKEQNDPEALDFNAQYRSVYSHVISVLTSRANGPKVFRFDTGQASLDETVDKMLTVLDLRKGAEVSPQ